MEGYRPTILVRPREVKDALVALGKEPGSARLVAGNTALYSISQYGALDGVSTLVDASLLPLRFIRQINHESSRGIEIGATTTFSEIATYGKSAEHHGLEALFETARKITPPQIRNVATMGGALCSGIPFFDMPTTVLGLGGTLKIVSSLGEREISADKNFLGYFETAVANNEILHSIKFGNATKRAGSAFTKLGRASADFAVVNACSYLELEENSECATVRVAIGAVADTPVRWTSIEKAVIGRKLSLNLSSEICKDSQIVDFVPSPSLNAPSSYKKIVLPILAREVLHRSLERASASKTEGEN